MSIFWDRLNKLLKEQEKSQYSLAEECEIPLGTFNKWKKKGIYPKTDKVLKIAEVLNVSVEFLLTGDETIEPAVKSLQKYPELKKIAITLGFYPNLIPIIEGYLEGRVATEKKKRRNI